MWLAMMQSRRTARRRSQSGGCGVSGAGGQQGGLIAGVGRPGGGSRPTPLHPLSSDYRRTQLAPYVKAFEQFLEEMERARRGERLWRSGERWGSRRSQLLFIAY